MLNSGHMHTNKSHNNLIVMTLIEQQYQMTLILNSVPLTHTLMSYVSNVDLEIITMLSGERTINKKFTMQNILKGSHLNLKKIPYLF